MDVRLVTSKRRGKGTVGFDDAMTELAKYTVKGSDIERIPPSELPSVERALYRRRMIETYGECNAQKGKVTKGETPYLDNQRITDGAAGSGKVKKLVGKVPNAYIRECGESLRRQGARMIRDGRRQEWLELLKTKYAERLDWRKRQLAARYPLATFLFLDGDVVFGISVAVREVRRCSVPFG